MKFKNLLNYCVPILFCGALTTSQSRAQNIGNTPGDTSHVSFSYHNQNVTLKTVRANNGTVWLQQNLGSTKVADSTTDTSSYGDLFQWGRWDDGHQSRYSSNAQVSTLTINDPTGLNGGSINFYRNNIQPLWWGSSSTTTPSGNALITDTWSGNLISSTNGKDPCSAIGSGWHMPSKSDWDSVMTSENIVSGTTSGFSSHLKMPLGGYRNGANGGVQLPGYGNLYWTTTNYSSTGPYAVYNNSMTNYWSRGYGASVRCIKTENTCNGMPTGGIINVSDTLICPNETIISTLSGYTQADNIAFQWQKRIAGQTSFSNIVGATGFAFSDTTINANTAIRCRVICLGSNDTAYSDTAYVNINHLAVDLGADTTICSGNTIELNAGVNATYSYNWSDGSNNSAIDVNQSGTYWVSLQNEDGCTGTDTITVTVNSAPIADSISVTNIGNSFTFDLVNLTANADSIYWSFGDNSSITNQNNVTHVYNSTGTFTVTAIIINGCGQNVYTINVQNTTTGVGNIAQNDNVIIYPTLVNDELNILVNKGKLINIVVYDLSGKQVISSTLSKLNMNVLSTGNYVVKVNTTEGFKIQKITKK